MIADKSSLTLKSESSTWGDCQLNCALVHALKSFSRLNGVSLSSPNIAMRAARDDVQSRGLDHLTFRSL
jgi:hypothetical protein